MNVMLKIICLFLYFLLAWQAHLIEGRGSGGGTVDSARQNLAATFVNAFVNAGFGQVCIRSYVLIAREHLYMFLYADCGVPFCL